MDFVGKCSTIHFKQGSFNGKTVLMHKPDKNSAALQIKAVGRMNRLARAPRLAALELHPPVWQGALPCGIVTRNYIQDTQPLTVLLFAIVQCTIPISKVLRLIKQLKSIRNIPDKKNRFVFYLVASSTMFFLNNKKLYIV